MKKTIPILLVFAMLLASVSPLSASAATPTFGLGQTWTLPGQWEFVIHEIKTHNLCNDNWNKKHGFSNEQVVIIDFSFKNIGHSQEYNDLFFGGSNIDVYDEQGEAAEWYIACDHTKNSHACKVVGSKSSHATIAYALKNPSNSITISVQEYYDSADGRSTKAEAVFKVPVGKQQTQASSQNASQNNINVTLDGKTIQFDVQPTIINGRTMVPLRAIFESLNASVNWNNTTRTVTSSKGNTNISLKIDSSTMYVNGSAVALDSPARIINGRTLVPVRAISEAFKCSVDWNNSSRTVIIKSAEESTYQSFVDFVKTKGSYNRGKYGISTSIPKSTSSNGTDSWGSVSLLYDTSSDMLQLQVLMYRDSITSGESNYFLILDLKDKAEKYNWEYQRTYERSGGFWTAKGTLKANATSYVSGDSVKLSKMIYGKEIMQNDMVTDVGLHMSLAAAYMNNIFKDNGSTLTFDYFGIK